MLFYEDFVKKIKDSKEENFGEREVFTLEVKKKLVLLGTGVPLFLVGCYFAYVGYLQNYKIIQFVFAIMFFYVASTHVKKMRNYKLIIDNTNGKLIHNSVEIIFDTIDSCTMKEGAIGKNGKEYAIILDIITNEKKQYIIPLIMNKKERFVKNIKCKTEGKFRIK